MRIVSLEDFTPGERFDGLPWTLARFEEAASSAGAFTALETINLATGPGVSPAGLDSDPTEPASRGFTTALATLSEGYYRIVFIDAAGHEQEVGPVFSDSRVQAYTSVQAVRRVLSPDGDRDAKLGTAAWLSDNEIEEAIEDAATEINGRLAPRYDLPFETIPPLVETLNRDIAAYLATLTYRRGTPIPDSDPVALRYDRAQKLLTSAAKGDLQLVDEAEGAPVSTLAEATVVNPYSGDLFSADEFFGPDPCLPGPYG